ncbi:hypothetical protein ACJMK2_038698 [Sinanodonta woodiana]|uniref:Uncharacterized protein n=1 Tax=Sinanodonta woodiana TaxID=1069815 RepID=A0ABD3W9R8_SINWO
MENVDTGINLSHLVVTGEIITGRKRQMKICDACCGDALCNDDACETVKDRLHRYAIAGKLNYTTLTLMH